LRVKIVDRDGKSMEVDCLLNPLDRRVRGSYLPMTVVGVCGGKGFAAIDWEIQISYQDRNDENVDTSVKVTVPPGGRGEATVVIDP
jgi:hypothetical protein